MIGMLQQPSARVGAVTRRQLEETASASSTAQGRAFVRSLNAWPGRADTVRELTAEAENVVALYQAELEQNQNAGSMMVGLAISSTILGAVVQSTMFGLGALWCIPALFAAGAVAVAKARHTKMEEMQPALDMHAGAQYWGARALKRPPAPAQPPAAGDAVSALFRLHEHPDIKTAGARVEDARREVRRIEDSLQGGLGVKVGNFPDEVDRAAAAEMSRLQNPILGAVLGSAALCGTAAFHGAAMLPALASHPFATAAVATVAGLVGAKLLVQRLTRPIFERGVEKRVNAWLEGEKTAAQDDLRQREASYDAAVRRISDEAALKATQGTTQPASTATVAVESNAVRLGSVVVSRRADLASETVEAQ